MRKFITGTFKTLLVLLLLLLVTIALIGFTADTDLRIPEDFVGEYHDIAGLKLRVWQQGQGQDVLLIHGLPGSIEDWDPINDKLAETYRVTVYDRPGHGFSELDKDRANLAGNVAVAFAVIEQLQLQNVILVGHSYGGSIIAQMASQNPENVAGYVSVAGAVTTTEPTDPIYHGLVIPILGAGLSIIGNELIGEPMMKEGLTKSFHPNPLPDDYIPRRKAMWLSTKNAQAMAFEEVNLAGDLRRIPLTQIKQPFAILQGADDGGVVIKNAEMLKRAIPHATLKVLPETGHFIHFVHPQQVIKAVHQIANSKAPTTALGYFHPRL